MQKRTWKEKIKEQCQEAGTYKECFDPLIYSLACILEKRDTALEEFEDSGESMVVDVIQKNGTQTTQKNPRISIWDDLNKTALTYWKELGLTPSVLKKINNESFVVKAETSGNTLMALLQKAEGK